MSDIRIASGTVTAFDLTTTASYLVSNWTRQTDMLNRAAIQWLCYQVETTATQTYVAGAEVGSGLFVGGYSCEIEFAILTEDMRQYIHDTIMGSKPIAPVTIYLNSPLEGMQSYQGELVSPFTTDSELSYTRYDDAHYTNVRYLFRRGTQVTTSELLMESGDFLLLETGDKILLESQ